ncbi:MAG: methylenetetrahydrofolate--tRNA-(uracil(54)-C(5))-methyltransferase (FADH(2)-oxidizing) TrmFO [Clostridiales bacterium]|nr:methylenetetrahydrofolate--tRNA-(uracil(54)-C(5))-methyltransferase (FADH(2)-oxidizing) TrmFO [Clostridiales bacterium]
MSAGVVVAGAGLAGCEAALAAARVGVPVTLIEMKPGRRTPAHHSDGFAELVCSNSLKASRLESAAGLLKEELKRLGSVCMEAASGCAVPAGGALAVDRDRFSAAVTARVLAHPLIRVEHREVVGIGELTAAAGEGAVVIATGPLTADALAAELRRLCGGALSFYDAAAPIVAADSVDRERAFAASRYGRDSISGETAPAEEGDYLNCPMNREEYEIFHAALVEAQTAPLHDFDQPAGEGPAVYEGCMPIEVLAKRGRDAIRFGPMKPVGLRDPRTGHRPWAVLQLRRENAGGTMLNLVGFQTNLTFGEQRRVFGLIPALHRAEFFRYGVMHRNTFLDSPRLLTAGYRFREEGRLFFAGQMTGVEGYMESASSGLLAGLNAARLVQGEDERILPVDTMTGALAHYISHGPAAGGRRGFQPMGANFGVLPPLDDPPRDKHQRYAALAQRALDSLERALLQP